MSEPNSTPAPEKPPVIPDPATEDDLAGGSLKDPLAEQKEKVRLIWASIKEPMNALVDKHKLVMINVTVVVDQSHADSRIYRKKFPGSDPASQRQEQGALLAMASHGSAALFEQASKLRNLVVEAINHLISPPPPTK